MKQVYLIEVKKHSTTGVVKPKTNELPLSNNQSTLQLDALQARMKELEKARKLCHFY